MSSPTRRRLRSGVLVLASVITLLSLLLVVGVISDDREITAHQATAVADVLAVGTTGAAISFATPDGITRSPALGVFYPGGLAEDQRVEVEYSTVNPDLVRVAGRNWTHALLPVGAVLLLTWALTVGVRYLLRARGGAGEGRRGRVDDGVRGGLEN